MHHWYSKLFSKSTRSEASDLQRKPIELELSRPQPKPKRKPQDVPEEHVEKLCTEIAETYVQKDGKFHEVDNPGIVLSSGDLDKVLLLRLQSQFPEIEVTHALWKAVKERAIRNKQGVPG